MVERWTILACVLLGSGCTALNADYGSRHGGHGGGTDSSGTGVASTSAATSGDEGATSHGDDPSAASMDDTTAASHGTNTSEGSSTSDGPDDTGPLTSGANVEPDTDGEPSEIVLFATEPLGGDFAMGGNPLELGAGICDDTALDHGLDLACLSLLPILATHDVGFGDLPTDAPALEDFDFISPEGDVLAESYQALLAGNVSADFASATTAHLGAPTDPSFWWGPTEPPHTDCEGWTADIGTGRTRTFDSGGSGMILHGINACGQSHRLLCACVRSDG